MGNYGFSTVLGIFFGCLGLLFLGLWQAIPKNTPFGERNKHVSKTVVPRDVQSLRATCAIRNRANLALFWGAVEWPSEFFGVFSGFRWLGPFLVGFSKLLQKVLFVSFKFPLVFLRFFEVFCRLFVALFPVQRRGVREDGGGLLLRKSSEMQRKVGEEQFFLRCFW